MLSKLILIAIVILVVFSIWLLTDRLTYGAAINKSTEQKYLRNINRYKSINDGQIWIGDDSLAGIAKILNSGINPFYKYYILHDVGIIPRHSPLTKKIDSILATYTDPPNRYK